jgi:hypothetical protein
MKLLLTSLILLTTTLTIFSQTDTTKTEKPDTIRVGGMIIINKKNGKDSTTIENKNDKKDSWTIRINGRSKKKNRLTTSWFNFDLGFANYDDQSMYTSAATKDYARATRTGEADFTDSDLRLKTGKSINFNLWIVRQSYGITRDSKFQAKWGVMLESNNYRYDNNVSYNNENRPFVFRDSISFRKNKLAADYLTIPLMLGFSSNPHSKKGFEVSAGISVGYLYSSRNKQISEAREKEKNRGNFDLEPFKFQYIAEIGMGALKLYGSYAPQSIYKRGLDIRPFNVGFRFGNW